MTERESSLEHLNKITVSLEAGSSPDQMDFTPEPVSFEFIYGIGPEGLSPFEFELAGKKPGEAWSMQISAGEIAPLFEHLRPPLPPLPREVEAFYLRVEILQARPADQREVIAAMAELAGCGDHCCGH